MAGRRHDCYFVGDLVLAVDEAQTAVLFQGQDVFGQVVARVRSLGSMASRHSASMIRYSALGKVGTATPSTMRVFQPLWSAWRCVLTTTSTSSGCTPRAASSVIRVPFSTGLD